MPRQSSLLMTGLGAMSLMAAEIPVGVVEAGTAEEHSPPVRETFREPPVWRAEGGALQRALEIRRAKTKLGNRQILTLAYEGGIPGPTWRLKPGDHIKLRLINNMTPTASAPSEEVLSEDLPGGLAMETPTSLLTNIHVHGLQVDPRGNSDNVYLSIAPGEYFDYDIPIPENQPAGLFFYHPHRHMAATRQFWNGPGGAIIIEGGLDAVPEVKAAKARLMVVNELILNELGQVPAGTAVPTAGHVDFSTVPVVPSQIYFPINGVLRPTLTVRPGETQRWRIVNGAAHRALKLALVHKGSGERTPLHQIAQDGINFPVSKERESVLLASGNRVEVLVQAGEPGLYELKSLRHDQGHPGGPRPEVLLATLWSRGPKVSDPTAFPLTLIPSQMPDISGYPIAKTRTLTWSGDIMTAPLIFEVDGKVFDPSRVDQTITVGTTEEWTLVNHDVFQHPFHIHVNPFQVIDVNGADYPEPDVWWDTFALPSNGTVTLRTFFRPDVIGSTVLHCHILPHEDLGMMQRIDLVAEGPPSPPVIPVGPFPTDQPVPPPGTPRFKPLPSRPYVFTHLYPQILRDEPAGVAVGRTVEIQLPADPTLWMPSLEGDSVRQRGDVKVFPSIGQYDGASAIFSFKFRAVKPGCTSVTVRGDPPPLSWLEDPYVLALEAVRARFTGQAGECPGPQ